MSLREDYGLIINPDLLSEEYLPENIPGGDPQIKELSFCLKPALKRNKPVHAWLHGKSGTGKTATSKYILRQIGLEAGIKGQYINCWEENSLHFVMSEIMRELRILHTDQSNTPLKIEKFKRVIKNEPFILILDEIDQVPPKEKENILYNLATLGNLGLICISNSRTTLFDLEDRVKSRLSPETIEFRPYSTSDLLYILKQRAELSLLPGSWSDSTIDTIAELADGDARVGIQTLKNAAYHADHENETKIKDSHIQKGFSKAHTLKVTYQLRKLTEDHRMLFEIVKQNPGIQSDLLWQAYLDKVNEMKTESIANRTFSKYCGKLRDVGLIRIEPAEVKEGNVRRFSATDNV